MVEQEGGAPGPQQDKVIIIKLGGSSITDKTGYEALKPQGLQAAADVIQRAYEAGLKVIVVHGAGSFGHPQAKKYKINGGWHQFSQQGGGGGEEEQEERRKAFETMRYGFAATRASVLKLSNIILQELVGRGLPATTLPPCGSWDTQAGKVVKSNAVSVCVLLSLGFIPILHGDGVLDSTKGCNVLSGDTVILELARDVPGMQRVVFLTDVEGVYDKAPDLPGATLIHNIQVDDQGEIVANSVNTEGGGSKGDDVTGGMKLKLGTAIAIQVDHDGRVPVFICNVESEAATRACLEGHVGTAATVLTKQQQQPKQQPHTASSQKKVLVDA